MLQIDIERKKNVSYENLLEAYMALVQANKERAAECIVKIYESVLTEEQLQIYQQICMWTGETGISLEREREETTAALQAAYGDNG